MPFAVFDEEKCYNSYYTLHILVQTHVVLCVRLSKLTPGQPPLGWLNLTREAGATDGVIVLHGILNCESKSAYNPHIILYHFTFLISSVFFCLPQIFLFCTYIVLYILYMMTSVVSNQARGTRDRMLPSTTQTTQPQKQIQVGFYYVTYRVSHKPKELSCSFVLVTFLFVQYQISSCWYNNNVQ